MFKKLSFVFIFSVISSFSLAFPVRGHLQVTPNRVVVQFCNTTCAEVLECSANVTGILQTGYPVSFEGSLTLPPGQCGYAYVYANYPYYFVNGEGYADCESLAPHHPEPMPMPMPEPTPIPTPGQAPVPTPTAP